MRLPRNRGQKAVIAATILTATLGIHCSPITTEAGAAGDEANPKQTKS